MLHIETVLCRAGKMDNYSYILHDDAGTVAVIDPSETAPIVARLQQLNLRPQYILNTHHHYDHTDANLELKQKYSTKIIGNINDSARIPGLDFGIEPGSTYLLPCTPSSCHPELAEGSQPFLLSPLTGEDQGGGALLRSPSAALSDFTFVVVDASAHTQGHILYYFPKAKSLFTGDTLFNLCIGGLFEGTAEQMFAALQKIRALPEDTKFYPGHEYTLHGAHEAWQYFQGNDDIRRYLERAQNNLQKGLPAGPFTLAEEKKCNPYLAAENLEEFKSL